MTTPGTTVTRVLDYLERRLWGAQDQPLTAAGWEVTRIGRWRRRYRHPHRYAASNAAGPAPTRHAPITAASNAAGTARATSPAPAGNPDADNPGASAPGLTELVFGRPTAATARSARLVFVSASGQLADSPPYLPGPLVGGMPAWPVAGTQPAGRTLTTAPPPSSRRPATDQFAARSTLHTEPDAVDRLVTGLLATCREIAGYFVRSS